MLQNRLVNLKKFIFSFKRKENLLKFPVVMILCFLITGVVFGREESYSLQKLINISLKKNTDMIISQGEKEISRMEKREVELSFLPKINMEGGYIYSSMKNGTPLFAGANGNFEVLGLLSLSQTIFNPDLIENLKASKIKTEKQSIMKKQIELNVIRRVIRAYFFALMYKNEIKIFTENLNAFKLMFEQSQLLFNAGSVPEIDVKRSKVELLLQKRALTKAINNFISVKNHLKELIGMKLHNKIKISEFNISKVVLKNLEFYKKAAWKNRPDWKLMQKEKKLAKLKISISFLKHFPAINGALYYGWDTTGKFVPTNHGFQIVVTASLPLWHWGALKTARQTAKIRFDQIGYKIERLARRISQEIENSYNEAKLQKEQVALMKESMAESTLALKMANIGYKEGTITNLNLINTQKLYTKIKLEYMKALYSFYLAKVNLFNSIGELKEDMSWIN